MNGIDIDVVTGMVTSGFGRHFRTGLATFALISTALLATATTTIAEEDKATDYPGLGKPRVLFTAFPEGDWTYGHFGSLAFAEDSESILASLGRPSGRISLISLLFSPSRGEVRSFDLVAREDRKSVV